MATIGQAHRELLARWRTAMNLVGPGPLEPQFEDCARALSWMQPTGCWVDLGTGAGFPGLVMADLFPTIELDLVDSRQKRCRFLDEVLAMAKVGPERVRVHCQRTEDLAARPWDGLVARAYAPPEQVVRDALRLVRPGGTLVLFLQDDAAAPSHERLTHQHTHRYTVDGKARKSVGLTVG